MTSESGKKPKRGDFVVGVGNASTTTLTAAEVLEHCLLYLLCFTQNWTNKGEKKYIYTWCVALRKSMENGAVRSAFETKSSVFPPRKAFARNNWQNVNVALIDPEEKKIISSNVAPCGNG